jgi:outer membrane protein
MKNCLLKIILTSLLVSALAGTAGAQNRIATVDLRKLFDNYWKTKQADAALKDRAADMEKEHKNMLDDWKKAKEDYQGLLTSANDLAVSTEERERRKKAAEDKLKYIKDTEDTITQYERQARATLDEQRRRMRDNILGEIRKVINAKAKISNYDLVVDTAAESVNNTPVVLFAGTDHDLTSAVLEQLNVGAPADVPAPDQKKEEKSDASKKDDKKK